MGRRRKKNPTNYEERFIGEKEPPIS